MKLLISLAALAAVASAIQITEPKQNAKLDFSQTNTIKWTTVDSDADEFKIELIDASTSPESSEVIVAKVESDTKEYKFTNFVAKPGKQYKVKFFAIDDENTGQLAESQMFEVTKSGVKSSTTAPPTSEPTGTEDAPASSSSTAGAGVGAAIGVAGPLAALLAMLA